MSKRHASLAAYVMLSLAALGIADAFYDSYAIYTGQPLWCPPPIDGCNIVAASPYAYILRLPVGYFGVAYYLCMFVLAAWSGVAPKSRGLRLTVVLCAAIGVAFSVYFMRIQFGVISTAGGNTQHGGRIVYWNEPDGHVWEALTSRQRDRT